MKFSIFLFVVLNLYVLHINGFRVFNSNGAVTILAFENEKVDINCQTDMLMTYCGFIHPSGKRYSFSGHDLNNGHCTISIKATKQDVGQWSCHVGRQTGGVEMVQTIYLRVVNQLAAIQPNLSTVQGKRVTLECVFVKEMVSIKYCRFEPPKGSTFSLDSSITAKKPLLHKYYFPLNKSIDRGDCAVTIRNPQYDDEGVWTCAAGLGDGKEYIDKIELQIKVSSTKIIAGVIAILCLLTLVYTLVNRLYFMGTRRNQELEVIEEQELDSMQVQELGSMQDQELGSTQDQELSSMQDQELGSMQNQELSSMQDQELGSTQGSPSSLSPELPRSFTIVTVHSPPDASVVSERL